MSALEDREVWASRYRMCMATDARNSERRWRAVAGWAAAHAALEDESSTAEPEPTRPDYGLSVEAWEWIEDGAHRRGFVVDYSTFMGRGSK